MKKLITSFAIMAILTVFSTQVSAQDFNPQAMVQRQIERMETELTLSKDQIKKIEPLVSVRMEKMMEFRQAGMEREAMQAEIKKLNDAQLESLKAILTPEQLEKYKTMQAAQRQGGGAPRN
jgi:septal ring factor EnvC (AmiA/AmiB activator)